VSFTHHSSSLIPVFALFNTTLSVYHLFCCSNSPITCSNSSTRLISSSTRLTSQSTSFLLINSEGCIPGATVFSEFLRNLIISNRSLLIRFTLQCFVCYFCVFISKQSPTALFSYQLQSFTIAFVLLF